MMRKVIATVVAAWAVMSFGSTAVGGEGFFITVDPTSGPPGTTVTVTAYACGDDLSQKAAADSNGVIDLFAPGSGQLIVVVAGWGEPFESGFVGGVNDGQGVATATFQVPSVATGTYTVAADCVPTCAEPPLHAAACATSELRAAGFGSYAPGSFTVTAPANTPADTADAVPAQASTTG